MSQSESRESGRQYCDFEEFASTNMTKYVLHKHLII